MEIPVILPPASIAEVMVEYSEGVSSPGEDAFDETDEIGGGDESAEIK